MTGEAEMAAAIAPAITLASIGYLVIMLVGAYLFYQLTRLYSSIADDMEAKTSVNKKYSLFEGAMVKQMAEKIGISLEKEELLEQEKVRPKNFKRAVHEELVKKITGEKK